MKRTLSILLFVFFSYTLPAKITEPINKIPDYCADKFQEQLEAWLAHSAKQLKLRDPTVLSITSKIKLNMISENSAEVDIQTDIIAEVLDSKDNKMAICTTITSSVIAKKQEFIPESNIYRFALTMKMMQIIKIEACVNDVL